MKRKLIKFSIYFTLTLLGILIVTSSILFYTYKKYTCYVDASEKAKFTIGQKMLGTTGVLIQVLKDKTSYKDYIYSIGLKGNENVLDFGAGWGNEAVFLDEILASKGKLTCIDIEKSRLDVIKKRLENHMKIEYLSGDINQLEIKPDTYDAIVMYYVLHCINKESLEKTMGKLYYVLKKDGEIVIREPNYYGFSLTEMRDIMIKTGFTEVGLKTNKDFKYNDGIFIKK